jgi:hypothetical protein
MLVTHFSLHYFRGNDFPIFIRNHYALTLFPGLLMSRLKNIVLKLSEVDYASIEEVLINNHADNFLFLLRAYRKDDLSDKEIAKDLGVSINSVYVLKSRLNDKIQEHLAGDIYSGTGEILRQLHRVPEMCYETSREVAVSMLEKLEEDLRRYDLHNELLVVYSGLKKIHLYSGKYFHYSQLYNKHAAFNLSLEKCEEILANFNRTLAEYDLSRLPQHTDTLQFLSREMDEHLALNPSRQIEIIRNLILIQLSVFCGISNKETDTLSLLEHTEQTIAALPSADPR